MFVLYAFLFALVVCGLDLIYIKTYQLESYKLKNTLLKLAKYDFAFGKKTPLKITKRIKRLFFINFLTNFVVFLMIFAFLPYFWQQFVVAFLVVFLSNFCVLLSFVLALPIENLIKQNYIRKAKKKLSKMKCKKIAITGSFGKTSTKHILYDILKEEFDVCATPKSFNTPMGICKTVLEDLKETDDYFIVEFGARQSGDIDFLAKLVSVDFGILTPIGNCHLQTFGSVENIENTKYELCENAKDFVVFNGRNKSTRKLYNRFQRRKYMVCEEGSFAYAKDIVSSAEGSRFSLVLDDKQLSCKTRLLGRANIDNIVVAASMAYLLGESLYGIAKGILNARPIPHRLEMIKTDFVTCLDDSYNSNLDGFKEALSVLSGFDGRKIVVSPGIVELGKQQEEVNAEVGRLVAEVADIFVIMNETNRQALLTGAENLAEIYFAKNREQQQQLLRKIIKKGDVVLFENDFPDNIK